MELTVLNILFYAFGGVVLFSALMVISVRNPVHSVLFLIFAFFNAAGLLVLLGTEYIAMTLVIVYVGAVAVLFLFVVMMMDIDFSRWHEGFIKRLPLGLTIAFLLFFQLGALFYAALHSIPYAQAEGTARSDIKEGATNAETIGQVLYTDYAFVFQMAGLVLLVAMIGAIVLTLRQREQVKRQDISKQLARRRSDGVRLVQVESGKGVDL